MRGSSKIHYLHNTQYTNGIKFKYDTRKKRRNVKNRHIQIKKKKKTSIMGNTSENKSKLKGGQICCTN